ncbi:MAG: hypothetical protein JWR05_3530 [Mucilaginibacter sp.]|nr:hypothetical protein [Mucilaginibacter sp.]
MGAKLIKLPESTNALSIAHLASTAARPFYYVQEAQLNHSRVTVSFCDENEPDGPTVTKVIKTKDLTDFITEFYGDYINTGYSEHRIQDVKSPLEYLKDNLDSVVTEFLNAKGVSNA